ncbi:MAG: hypothetical protein Q8R81_02920 [Novosphingobium sp.]|uniref:hypothetical protein n=1 Tax=Novosphingobium sp. TaxID=1874826 RepID=UPI0027356F3C|nr:hypothetical protein [Novosphingobium sp.]MDP3549328.1 hypothetical protein [Novosphingobium sp.]
MIDNLDTLIVERGLAASTYVLDLNRSLSVPHDFQLSHPWNLPSRLFRFPIEVSAGLGEAPRRIGLMHPLLTDHPFVRHVEEVLGIALAPGGAPNAYGVSNAHTGLWWHAVDLVSAGQWRALLETRRFTTDEDIARAVAYGLSYSAHGGKRQGYLSVSEARTIMGAMNAAEPAERCGLLAFSRPMPCQPGKAPAHWPINHPALAANDVAWALIHGIESGWLAHDRAGFLHWTEAGRERDAAGEAETFVTASGQGAFAF